MKFVDPQTFLILFRHFFCISIKPNLRSTVYCSAIAAGGAKEWDFAWNMFKDASLASEADKLRAALACATQPWLLNRYAHCKSEKSRVSQMLLLTI